MLNILDVLNDRVADIAGTLAVSGKIYKTKQLIPTFPWKKTGLQTLAWLKFNFFARNSFSIQKDSGIVHDSQSPGREGGQLILPQQGNYWPTVFNFRDSLKFSRI